MEFSTEQHARFVADAWRLAWPSSFRVGGGQRRTRCAGRGGVEQPLRDCRRLRFRNVANLGAGWAVTSRTTPGAAIIQIPFFPAASVPADETPAGWLYVQYSSLVKFGSYAWFDLATLSL